MCFEELAGCPRGAHAPVLKRGGNPINMEEVETSSMTGVWEFGSLSAWNALTECSFLGEPACKLPNF